MSRFNREEFAKAERTMLQRGKWGNADVWRVTCNGEWVVKDFKPRRWWFRETFGRLLARREYRFLKALAGVTLAVDGIFMLDKYAVVERYFDGRPLNRMQPGDLPTAFFETLEACVKAIHDRGVVHLDLRNGGNILVLSDNTPLLLDFQSALSVHWLPSWLSCRMGWIDLSGVYKHWAFMAPGTMGEERERVLVWQIRNRKWWRIRGYRFSPRHRPLKPFEHELLSKHGEW